MPKKYKYKYKYGAKYECKYKCKHKPHKCCHKVSKLTFSIIGDNLITKYTGVSMLILTDTQKCSLQVSAVSAKGNPALVENVTFVSTDETILTVVQDVDDPSKAVVSAVGPVGSAQVLASADADLGDGVVLLEGILDVEVKAGEAVTLAVTTGTPEAQ